MLTPFEHSNHVAKYNIQRPSLALWHTNGSGDTFDPRIDFPAGYSPYWEMSTPGASGEIIVPAVSGADISFLPQAAGPHRAVLKGVPRDLITRIDANADKCTGDLSSWTLPNSLGILYLYTNSFTGDLSGWTLPNSLGILQLNSNSFTGDLSSWTLPNSLGTLSLSINSFTGDLSSWTLPNSLQYLGLSVNSFTGDLSGWTLPNSLTRLFLQSNSFTVSTTFAGVGTGMRDFQIQNNGLISAHVDNVLWSIWNARAGFTYATPALNVGGTNQPPTGAVAAPPGGGASNSDWNWNAGTGKYEPLTGGAVVWDLAKDVNGEGFKKWAITYNGGTL